MQISFYIVTDKIDLFLNEVSISLFNLKKTGIEIDEQGRSFCQNG